MRDEGKVPTCFSVKGDSELLCELSCCTAKPAASSTCSGRGATWRHAGHGDGLPAGAQCGCGWQALLRSATACLWIAHELYTSLAGHLNSDTWH